MLNTKFSELGTRLTLLEEKLDTVTKDIHLKLNAVETTVQEASTHAPEIREEIEHLKLRLAELNETVSNQVIMIHQLNTEVEDLKNRSLRKTLVFRNVKKQSEKTWDDKNFLLANEISKNMQYFSKEEIINNIERAHRDTTARRNPSATSVPSFLVAKITNKLGHVRKN